MLAALRAQPKSPFYDSVAEPAKLLRHNVEVRRARPTYLTCSPLGCYALGLILRFMGLGSVRYWDASKTAAATAHKWQRLMSLLQRWLRSLLTSQLSWLRRSGGRVFGRARCTPSLGHSVKKSHRTKAYWKLTLVFLSTSVCAATSPPARDLATTRSQTSAGPERPTRDATIGDGLRNAMADGRFASRFTSMQRHKHVPTAATRVAEPSYEKVESDVQDDAGLLAAMGSPPVEPEARKRALHHRSWHHRPPPPCTVVTPWRYI